MSLREALKILLALAYEAIKLREGWTVTKKEEVEAIKVVEGALAALNKIKGVKL